jgi:DNA (cytosine-5)-methyltransferase 1
MTVYYNEIDPYAAQWLRNLIAAGHLAKGEVDERSITEIQPDDLLGFDQCHFFAGIGVWGHALRRAGWADDRPVWTGSCPCQPFSAAGKQEGFADERHLWPTWFNLIRQCRPAIVLGEQVASALDWLDLVSTDMEDAGYAFGAADLCAAGFGGAHIRQRLYWVGHSRQPGLEGYAGHVTDGGGGRNRVDQLPRQAHLSGWPSGLGDADSARTQTGVSESSKRQSGDTEVNDDRGNRLFRSGEGRSEFSGLANAKRDERGQVSADAGRRGEGSGAEGLGERSGYGSDECRPHAPTLGRDAADWLYCRDGKWRPVEPGTFPLADAAASRVGRLRAYGNALDAETATQFVAAVMDCAP